LAAIPNAGTPVSVSAVSQQEASPAPSFVKNACQALSQAENGIFQDIAL
jgi:hypothetical protein